MGVHTVGETTVEGSWRLGPTEHSCRRRERVRSARALPRRLGGEQQPGVLQSPAAGGGGSATWLVSLLVEKFDTELFSQIFQPNHQTLEGSFSAVSTPILRPNTHFAAFFEIYKIATPLHRSKLKIFANFCQTFSYFC